MDSIVYDSGLNRPFIVGEYIHFWRLEWWKWFIVEPQNRKHLLGKLYWNCE